MGGSAMRRVRGLGMVMTITALWISATGLVSGESRKLPNSGLKVWVSSRYWEHGTPRDRSKRFEVDVSVPFSARDYFAGNDPVLDAAIDWGGSR